jgi:CheY-like chemotaxis protein
VSEPSVADTKPVLVVEDNEIDLHLMKTLLEGVGYEVKTATDGDVGAAMFVSQEWAFAIVDLLLPGKDGVEVIQIGRTKHPDLQIIIVSGSSNASLIDAAFRAGADFHLTKPIELQELLGQLKGHSHVPDVPEPDAVEAPVEVDRTLTVVAVGVCPGDVEMGCGGVLSKHRAEGHRIVIINLAGGGDPQAPAIASANLAADLLEAQIESMGDESSGIVDLDQATTVLRRVFEAWNPGILYLPTASSDRASSVECHRVALALAEEVPNILAYQDPGATVDFRPRFFVDLAPQIKRKLELVGLYDKLKLKNVGTDMAKPRLSFGDDSQNRPWSSRWRSSAKGVTSGPASMAAVLP